MRLFILSAVFALCSPALAQEATQFPAELQGVLGLSYGGMAEFGALEEDGTQISQRRIAQHDLDWKLEFAPAEGFAVVLGLDYTPALTYNYPGARPMLFEPVDGGGTYLLSDGQGDESVQASGVRGLWVGAALSPFNERYKRGQRSTWRLDAAYRTGSKEKNLWVAKDGKRGAAPGGSALRLAGAASQDLGTGNPWASVNYIKENGFKADLVDESGTTWARNVQLQPASQVEVRAGVEVEALDDAEQQTRVAVDFWLGFGYNTWQDITSGVLLPNVLAGGREIAMTSSGYTYALGGISLDYQINEFVRARTGPDFRFHTPFFPEHAYNVVTSPDHLAVGWLLRIEGMYQIQKAGPAATDL